MRVNARDACAGSVCSMRDDEAPAPEATSLLHDVQRMAGTAEGANMTEWITECGAEARAIPIGDPPPAPTASPDDIAHAHRLRLQIRERYPDRPDAATAGYWSVGVD
jgi:hypothetical protein